MKNVVITAGTTVGSVLSLASSIRSEINCNIYVICIDPKTIHIFSSSKYIYEAFLIKSSSELDYINGIKDWYLNKNFDHKPILYFTYDNSCYYIDNHREWFENRFELCLPSSEI